jgi:hypothetical protein
MRDNLRQDRAIRAAFIQDYLGQPPGQRARPLGTLAALSSGLVASTSPQLPPSAAQGPNGTKPESRGKRFARWMDTDAITEQGDFLPYAAGLLTPLALQTLGVIRDGSVVGRGWGALMLPVVYKGRALPLVWPVHTGKKGPFPETLPIALVEQVQGGIPVGTSVVLLGEGACDGTGLQQTLAAG